MRYFLIMNPGSRSGRSKRLFDRIFESLSSAKIEYSYKITQVLEDAYQFSKQANLDGFDVIIAVGGDGTINGVLNGFYDTNGKRISNAAMGVIYTGTSPDFCKSYGIPVDVCRAIKTLLNNQRIQISVGKLSYMKDESILSDDLKSDNQQNYVVKYFGCCVNVGLGASLARRANGGIRKYLGDFLGTFLSLLVTVIKYKANSFTVIRDGRRDVVPSCFNISIGRTTYIASGIKVKHKIDEDRRLFYCLIVKEVNLLNFPGILKKIYGGKEIRNNESVSLNYYREFEVLSNSVNPEVELDGDPVGYLPCRIEIAEDRLELVC